MFFIDTDKLSLTSDPDICFYTFQMNIHVQICKQTALKQTNE